MSLIFDALRELETQPARAEPFAIAAANRAGLRRSRWRQWVGIGVLLAVAIAATVVLARRAPVAPLPVAASPAAASAPLAPVPVPMTSAASPVSATVATPVEPVSSSEQTASAPPASAPAPAAATAVAVTGVSVERSSYGMADTQSAPPARLAEPAANRPPPAAIASAASMPRADVSVEAAPTSLPAAAAAPAPAGPVAASRVGFTRPVIEDAAERQRIVVTSARAAAAAEPADERAVQRGVATFTEAMQREDFASARKDLDALSAQLPPDSLTLLRLRAWLALATANEAHARDLYEQILGRVGDDENAAINLAVLDARDGHIERARERLKRLLARNPGSAAVLRVLRSLDERSP